MVQYTIIRRSRRRTISIHVQRGHVEVRAPARASARDIDRFVQQKAGWIERHRQQQEHHLAKVSPRHWQNGETLWWLGQPLTLCHHPGARSTCERQGNTLQVRVGPRVQHPQRHIQRQVRHWYHQQGWQWLTAHLTQLPAAQALLSPEQRQQPQQWLELKSFRRRWGACYAQQQVALAWPLFAAPAPVVRYVLTHELCHLRHFHHAPAFWQLVARFCPDFRQQEAWLKTQGSLLLDPAYFAISPASSG